MSRAFRIGAALAALGFTLSCTSIASAIYGASNSTSSTLAVPDCSNNPLSTDFIANWANGHKAKRYSITVIDLTTDCTFNATDTTRSTAMASTAKVMIAVGTLEKVQAGKLTYSSVRDDLHDMITVSSNTAAVRLLKRMGGKPMMQKVINQFGLTHTYVGKSFGVTRTTAADQATLLRAILVDGTPYLSETNCARIKKLMKSVSSDQRWGAGYGLPTGFTAAVKNGWYHTVPGDLPPVNRSRVNTIGVIWDKSGAPRWILTGYSDMWRNDRRGKSAWNAVSAHVGKVLTTTVNTTGGSPSPAP